MKKLMIVFISLIINLINCGDTNADECLNDWNLLETKGNFQSTIDVDDCTKMDITMSVENFGVEVFGGRSKYFENAVGMLVNFKVTQVSGDYMVIGCSSKIAKTINENKIQAWTWLEFRNPFYTINFRVRERDGSDQVVKTFANGNLGYWKDGWIVGQEITVGFAIIEDEIWFYTPDKGAYVKVRLFDTITQICSDMVIWGGADEDVTSLNATVSGVKILYSDQLIVFPGPPIPGDFNEDGFIDLREAINALQVVTGLR